MRRTIIILYCVCLGVAVFGQESSKLKLPKFAIRANAGIPKIVSSEAFRNSFAGVAHVDGELTYKLFSEYFVGAGYAFTYFKSQKHFTDQRIFTTMQAHNYFVKVGYDKIIDQDKIVTISLNAGYNANSFHGIVYKHDSLIGKFPTSFSSSYIEPMIGFYLMTDPNFAIGAHLSYNYNFSQFDPRYAGFDKWLSYGNLNSKWNMSMITLGFGFYYGFVKK